MSKSKILLQFDTDALASSFDSIVAVDAGVDRLLTYTGVTTDSVESLVHGAMFTRGGDDLARTALFFGGSNVGQTDEVFQRARKCFFGDVRVSLMSDPNGSNTTAAAAVLSAEKHLSLEGSTVVVLAGTGPVGIRIAQLAASKGASVQVCSRKLERAEQAVGALVDSASECSGFDATQLQPCEVPDADAALTAVAQANVVFAAGAAGISLLAEGWQTNENLKVAIDVNAVPPAGIHGIQVFDKAKETEGTICYGAIGVGGLKMKIHRRCIKRLFESNDCVLDTQAIYELGSALLKS